MTSKPRKLRGIYKVRHSQFSEQDFIHQNDKEFKQRMRVSRHIFNYILTEIDEYIEKAPINLNPAPTPTHVQPALTLYRVGHSCTYPVVVDIFGNTEPLFVKFFIMFAISRLPGCITKTYICLVLTMASRTTSFIENCKFPCAGTWNGLHIYTTTKQEQYCVFKKRYSVSNMELAFYNKRI